MRLRGNIVSAHGGAKSSPVLLAAVMQCGVDEIAIHPADELDGNFLGTNRFAFAMVRATSKNFLRHSGDHTQGSLIALRLSLRKRVEVRDLRGSKQHRRGVGAGGHAGAASDAGGR